MSDKIRFINPYTDEYNAYQKSLLSYRDMVNVMKTKYEEGVEQGKDVEEIRLITGLSAKQIKQIKNRMNEG